jgi:hypothetical protein
VVKTFLEKGGTEILTSARLDVKQEVLQGLHKSLQVPDPPDSITSVLYQCLEFLYRIHIQEVRWCLISVTHTKNTYTQILFSLLNNGGI